MELDRSDTRPLYDQLKELLRTQIQDGHWAPGDRIPSEAELGDIYNVSRTTMRQAMADLTREGWFTRVRGKGTFVNQPKVEADMSSLFNLNLGALGPEIGVKHKTLGIDLCDAGTEGVERSLQLGAADKVIRIRRLRMLDDSPIALEQFHIPYDLAPGLLHEDISDLYLYPVLMNKYGVDITHATTWLEPTILDDSEARWLMASKDMPALLIRRLIFAADERPVVSTKGLIRGDRCKYVIKWDQRPVNKGASRTGPRPATDP